MKSAPMPNVEEQGTKTIEFSPKGNGNEVTDNTPATIKDDSQTKKTSITERFAAMVGMKPRDKEEATTATDKSKTFGTVSAITTEAGQEKEQVTAGNPVRHLAESKAPLVELGIDAKVRTDVQKTKVWLGGPPRNEEGVPT